MAPEFVEKWRTCVLTLGSLCLPCCERDTMCQKKKGYTDWNIKVFEENDRGRPRILLSCTGFIRILGTRCGKKLIHRNVSNLS